MNEKKRSMGKKGSEFARAEYTLKNTRARNGGK